MKTIETFFLDLRYATRVLRRDPGYTFFAVLTIALALGANAAIFSLVDGILLKSSGYPEPERIVQLWEKPPGGERNSIAPANYIDWTRQSRSFESMAAQTGAAMSYLARESGGVPVSLNASVVSAPYFDVFGVKPAWGRTFALDEDQQGKEKVTVLSHHTWLSVMGGDRSVVGRSILLNGEPYTVIGVMPGASEFDRTGDDLWIPLAFPPQVPRNYHFYGAVARLKRGVSLQQAQTEMSSIAAGIAERYPDVKKGWGATVDRYLDRVVGPQLRLSLTVLMWAVAAVLMIGSANLANLLMARATRRSREIAVRLAMGTGRGRLLRMLLTESLLLSACGACVGLALGYGLLQWIQSLLPPYFLPAEASVSMDGRVLLFLTAATLITCVAVGLAPALQATGKESAESLKEGGRSNTSGRGRMLTRNLFVGAQVAVAFILLVGGGLLARSFERLMRVETGFDSEGLIAVCLPLPMERNPDAATVTLYVDRILDEVCAVPGIREAAVTTGPPLQGWRDGMPFRLADKLNEEVGTGFKILTPKCFQTLGLPLKAGRLLAKGDTAASPPVVVVNESFVKRYFPQENPIGKRILVEKILPNRRGLGPQTSWEVVGVVIDEKGGGLESVTDVGAYVSFTQNPVVGLGIVARGNGAGGALIQSVARAVSRVDKTQVLDHPRTVGEIKSESLMSRRLTASLLGGLSVLAMLLACAGIYGVLSVVTAQRRQEMGIRFALGATRSAIVRLVVGGGAFPLFIGILVGLGGAIGLARFIQSMLFATDPIDPPTLAGVSVLFAAVALMACLVPAWKAARVDPMTALRQE